MKIIDFWILAGFWGITMDSDNQGSWFHRLSPKKLACRNGYHAVELLQEGIASAKVAVFFEVQVLRSPKGHGGSSGRRNGLESQPS